MNRKIIIKNKGLRERLLNDNWKDVEKGKLAELHVMENGSIHIKWIRSSQVYMRCPHCKRISNKGGVKNENKNQSTAQNEA